MKRKKRLREINGRLKWELVIDQKRSELTTFPKIELLIIESDLLFME
jgi:hypothetical protein